MVIRGLVIVYKLLIVDDEQIERRALRHIVDETTTLKLPAKPEMVRSGRISQGT